MDFDYLRTVIYRILVFTCTFGLTYISFDFFASAQEKLSTEEVLY